MDGWVGWLGLGLGFGLGLGVSLGGLFVHSWGWGGTDCVFVYRGERRGVGRWLVFIRSVVGLLVVVFFGRVSSVPSGVSSTF
ncbi:hypothetical protein B0I37DRAFT_362054 [Chaetomium sp. MPI-CAGE-AT-0009]|nr:hypothetical protein B0I37DRAFT_362054 [Chaetomium sp. MPI-CAGE-AT-0009]